MVEQIKEKLYKGEMFFVIYEGPILIKLVPVGDGFYNFHRRVKRRHGSWVRNLDDTNLPIDDISVTCYAIYDDEDEAISDFNMLEPKE